MDQLFPDRSDTVDLAAAYAYPPTHRSWLRASMIGSVDGAATVRGTSGALGGDADRAVLRMLRALTQCVVVGIGTARAEGYGPVQLRPDQLAARRASGLGAAPPPIAVVTGSADIDPDLELFTGAESPTVVLTTEAAPAERRAALARRADLVVVGEERVDLAAAVAALAERGHRRLLCEGGPGLLAQVVVAGLLDELCMTLSPVLAAGDAGRILGGPALDPPVRLRLAHALQDDGFLLLRYVPARDER